MLLKSEIDNSVNIVIPHRTGYFEARYVRRTDDYFIVYVSSQSGCKQACRFCYLTATDQTMDDMASLEDIEKQITSVLAYHDKQDIKPGLVHFNFMARGEPLLNPVIQEFSELYGLIERETQKRGLQFKIKISTIFPSYLDMDIPLLSKKEVDLYYSLYSLNEFFRKRWIPKGMNPEKVGELLQKFPGNLILHNAYIKNENDAPEDIQSILQWLERYNLKANFNVVRYNPYSSSQGEESSEDIIHQRYQEMIQSPHILRGRIVPRVGFDVNASCGMFIK